MKRSRRSRKRLSKFKQRSKPVNPQRSSSQLDYNNLEPRHLLAGVTDLIVLAEPVPFSQSMELLRSHLDLAENETMELTQIIQTPAGTESFRYQQMLNGLPVEHGVYTLHTEGDQIVRLSGEYKDVQEPEFGTWMNSEAALEFALDHVGATEYAWQDLDFGDAVGIEGAPEGELTLLANPDGSSVLAYKFDIYAIEPFTRDYIYVDASNGDVVLEYDRIHEADVAATGISLYEGNVSFTADSDSGAYRLRQAVQGVETYELNGSTNLGNGQDIVNSTTEFTDAGLHKGVQAHYAAETTYQYFLDTFGRDSYDDAGSVLRSYVGFGTNFVNAFWTGTEMVYGDGDGVNYGPLVSLDIAGHEIAHGVTEFSAGLIYQDESGALNESFSDIFGEVVEWYGAGPGDTNDWLLGDDIGLQGSGAIRSMSDPKLFNDPDTYLGQFWQIGGGDNGGVHTNSGVQNKWFYLLSEGGSGRNDNNENYNVVGIGIESAARIAYTNLVTYLSPGSTMQDGRDGAVQAAIDLFGAGSQEHISTNLAWRAVGLYGPELEIYEVEHVAEATEIYSGGLSDEIAAGEVDLVTLSLDAGQNLSVVVKGQGGLLPDINMLGPDGSTYAGTNYGGTAVIQNIPADAAGLFSLDVGGLAGSFGQYDVEFLLNASAEIEPFSSSNGTLASAQNIDNSGISLTPAGTSERLGVVGELSPDESPILLGQDFESGVLPAGWNFTKTDPLGRSFVTGDFGTASGNFALLQDTRNPGVNNLNEAIWTVDLSGLQDPVLEFWHAEWSDETTSLPPVFQSSRNGDGVAVSADGQVWYTILTDTDTPSGQWNKFSIDLASFADQKGITLGPNFKVKFQQYDDGRAPTDGRGYDEIRINATATVEDWFSFTLGAGETASLAAARINAGGTLNLELYDSNHSMLVSGSAFNSGSTNIVSRFTNPGSAADTYFARLVGSDTPYSLVVTKNADVQTDSNQMSNPQDLTDMPVVLANVAALAEAKAEPDSQPDGTILDSFFAGVALSNHTTGGSIYGVQANYNAPTGQNIFSPNPFEDGGFREDVNEFRADFEILQSSVSIDIGSDDGANDVGFLRAYDADFNLLEEVFTGPIAPGESQTLQINWFRPEIKTIIAGGVGNDVAPVDNLVYQVASDETDYFSINLTVGQELTAVAHLPGRGPLLFNNQLVDGSGDVHLRMELIAPDGSTVATGHDSLSAIATMGGEYTVEVSAVAMGGDYVLEMIPGPLATPFQVGDLNSGIAVIDSATGPGYLMYSSQSVHERFASHPPQAQNSNHLIAVRYVEGQGWQYSDNITWWSFEIESGDRLLAAIDFTGDTITSLQGQTGKVRGIDLGFVVGDLTFIADSWAGETTSTSATPSIPDGEFEVTGSYFVVQSDDPQYLLGNLEKGIAVDDAAVGTGYMLYSSESVHTRFAGAVNADNSDHLIAVRFDGTNWQFNTDSAWVNFTPVSSDRLIAELDFTADTVTSLQGNLGFVEGVAHGYIGGDLQFVVDSWDGAFDDGEFQVYGTLFATDQPISVGNVGGGIAVDDAATGTGFVMYSVQNLHTRFGTSNGAHPGSGVMIGSAENFAAVRYSGGSWQYNTNYQWVNFTPQAGDRLLATLNFDTDKGVGLRGVVGFYKGIAMGFQTGDIAINGNVWDGSPNAGEFGVAGSYFTVEHSTSAGNLGMGVAVEEAATGTGYIMYSQQNLHSRFGTSNGANPNAGVMVGSAEHFAAVRYNAGSWQYNTNYTWVDFTPETTDRLLATVDFDSDKMSSLKGTSGNLMGIESGFASGDLRFKANSWNGSYNFGEFQVFGSHFVVAQELLGVTQLAGSGSIAVDDAATGTGFIMHSDVDVHSRFSNVFAASSDNLIAVRFNGTSWQYNTNYAWLDFTPVAGDRLVAAVDFDANTITSLKGQGGKVQGVSRGFTNGDLVFHADQFEGLFNSGEFEVTGSYFLS